jgi:hypothetical protein
MLMSSDEKGSKATDKKSDWGTRAKTRKKESLCGCHHNKRPALVSRIQCPLLHTQHERCKGDSGSAAHAAVLNIISLGCVFSQLAPDARHDCKQARTRGQEGRQGG